MQFLFFAKEKIIVKKNFPITIKMYLDLDLVGIGKDTSNHQPEFSKIVITGYVSRSKFKMN